MLIRTIWDTWVRFVAWFTVLNMVLQFYCDKMHNIQISINEIEIIDEKKTTKLSRLLIVTSSNNRFEPFTQLVVFRRRKKKQTTACEPFICRFLKPPNSCGCALKSTAILKRFLDFCHQIIKLLNPQCSHQKWIIFASFGSCLCVRLSFTKVTRSVRQFVISLQTFVPHSVN